MVQTYLTTGLKPRVVGEQDADMNTVSATRFDESVVLAHAWQLTTSTHNAGASVVQNATELRSKAQDDTK